MPLSIKLLIVITVFASVVMAKTYQPVSTAPHLPSNALLIPMVAQAHPYSCGAAVLLSVLLYWQVFQGLEIDLHKPLQTDPQEGTNPQKIVEVAESFGLSAYYKENSTLDDLHEGLKKGSTIILDIQAWSDETELPWKNRWDDGHYVNLVALDQDYAYVMDPVIHQGYGYISVPELMERWHDFENQNGKRWEFQRLAIFISGIHAIQKLPLQITPVK